MSDIAGVSTQSIAEDIQGIVNCRRLGKQPKGTKTFPVLISFITCSFMAMNNNSPGSKN